MTDALYVAIDGLDRGGAEIYLLWLMQTFNKKFSQITLFTLHKNLPLIEAYEKLGVNVQKISPFNLFFTILRTDGIFYVHLAKSSFIAMLAGIFLKVRKKEARIFIHEHAALSYHSGRNGFFTKIKDWTFTKLVFLSLAMQTIHYIVITNLRLEELKKQYPKNKKLFAIRNSLPKEKIHKLLFARNLARNITKNASENPSTKTCEFFTFSRLHPGKQVKWAISACNYVAKKIPKQKFRLRIAGEGPEKESLESFCKNLTLPPNLRIDFLGYCETIDNLANESDVFLLPSKNEGFGLSLLESALYGILCIANDCPYGPQELATIFPNILLVQNPSKENFAKTTLQKTQLLLSNQLPNLGKQSTAFLWPDTEVQAGKIHAILLSQRSIQEDRF